MIGRSPTGYEGVEKLASTRAGRFHRARSTADGRPVVLLAPPGRLPEADRWAAMAREPADGDPGPNGLGVVLAARGRAWLVLEETAGRTLMEGLRGSTPLPQTADLLLALGKPLPGEAPAWPLGLLLAAVLVGREGEERAGELLALAERAREEAGRPDGLTHGALLDELRRWRTSAVILPVQSLATPWWTRPGLALPVLAMLGMVLVYWTHKNSRRSWARNQALPEIERVGREWLWSNWGEEAWVAYDDALEARGILGEDARLVQAWRALTTTRTIHSDPPGAEVWGAPFGAGDDWRRIGTTPLEGARFPRGISRLRLIKEGFEPLVDLSLGLPAEAEPPPYRLAKSGEAPPGMVLAQGGREELFLPGFDGVEPRELGVFWVDRHEVTNAEFRRFVDQGGYADPSFWTHPFHDEREDRELTFEEAMARFVDTTGEPGPATWVRGRPPGRLEDPVTGVSWFEAEAYAAFTGRRLPTVFHWNLLAAPRASSALVPNSNLEGDGLARVGTFAATHRFGTQDLAGNAREWCRNRVDPGGLRLVLGGAWNESAYAFLDPNALDPFDRSPTNGFRCVQPVDEEPEGLARTVDLPTRDFLAETPADDATFARYLEQFAYEKTPLNEKVVFRREVSGGFYERIEFDTAYGGERMSAFLFLPSKGSPPHQTVVVFPGSELLGTDIEHPFESGSRRFYYEFLLRSGRAVLFPVYQGLLDRPSGLERTVPRPTAQYRDHVIMWAKDLARSVDFVETRADLDAERLAYFGFNWGASLGAMLPAIERRFEASVLYVAGLRQIKPLPEVDVIHYVSRVETPTLMINGEYDFLYPVESSQRPMFELLGCRPEHKKWVTFEGSHAVPRAAFIEEALAWLDRFLGPVAL